MAADRRVAALLLALLTGGSLAYELDLWGRIRNSVKAARADARLCGLDAEAALLNQTVDAFGKAYHLTTTRHDGGIASGIDVNRARTALDNAKAQISAVANARIGVAKAAFFPTLTLSLSGGYEMTHGALFSTPNSFWGLGPASALLTLFDGGRRCAQLKISRAEYEELGADYRETVLGAFRQVEDAIAASRHLADQVVSQRGTATAAGRTSELALTRYRDGASDYLEVVTAQTDAMEAQRALLAVETQRMRASVALVKALGGPV